MELVKVQEDKNFLELEVKGEGHTLCNLLRFYGWQQKGVEIVSYNIEHPLVSSPVFCVKGKAPKKILLATVDALKKELKDIKAKVQKLK